MEPTVDLPTDIECAYLAGFVDGEGYIGFLGYHGGRQSHWYQVRLTLANTDLRPLMWVRARWGGSLIQLKVRYAHYRASYQLVLNGKEAVQAIRDALPYLLIKREQALVALEFYEVQMSVPSGPGRNLSPEHWEQRDALARRLAALK